MKVVTQSGTVDLGITETRPTIGITDFSRRVTDDFGVTTVVKRRFSRRMSVRLAVATANVDLLQQRLASLRATEATWIADDRYAWLSARGFFKDFEVTLAGESLSLCSLTIEGLAEDGGVPQTDADPAPNGRLSSLQLLQPIDIVDAVLVSSTVAEDDAPAWASNATYAKGARVLRAHRLCESLIENNVGKDPATEPSAWLDVAPTNRWAMFDQALGTSTVRTGSISVVLAPGAVNTLALLDVVGTSVRVQATGYDQTVPARDGALTFAGLPRTGNVTVTVNGSAQVAVGTLLVGRAVGLGITGAAPTAGITDYSRKEVDDFGAVTIVERAWAKRMTATALIRSDALDIVADRIAAVRARPSLWIGQDGQDAITVYGFFKDFSIEVGESTSLLSLTIEGLSEAAPIVPGLPTGGTVAWPDVTDPDGTKPTNNADKTSENTAKDTASVGGKPAQNVLEEIAEALARQDNLDNVIIPAINQAATAADGRIAAARGRADAAYGRADQAIADADTVNRRVDQLIAEGGGGSEGVDTVARSEIRRVEEAAIGRDDAAARTVDTLRASYLSGAGNLLTNSDFVTLDGWRLTYNGVGASLYRNFPNDIWYPIGENVLCLNQTSGPNGGGYCQVESDWFGVTGGTTLQAYAFTAAHRCDAAMLVAFYDSNGSPIADSGGVTAPRRDGGRNPANWDQTGQKVFAVPAGAVTARLLLRKSDTAPGSTDSFAWFWRPYVSLARPDQTSWNPYAVGSAKAVQMAADARVTREVTALALADQALARETTAVEARLNGNIAASARDVTTAFTTADAALAERSRVLEAAVLTGPDRNARLAARIAANETVLTDLPNQFATARRASDLEAQVNGEAGSRLLARANEQATVIADGKVGAVVQDVSSLRGEYNGTKGEVSRQAGVIVNLEGKASAYVRLVADAGNGRAALSLWSDQFGGAWQLTGNGAIDGNLTINGTITARAFNGASMAREASSSWSGSITPADGQVIQVPWSLSLPTIPPTGRFIYEYEFVLITNAGTSAPGGTDPQGRPITVHYVADGGGFTLSAADAQGNVYRPRPNASDRVLGSTDFAPTFTASVRKGTLNQTENGGDYVAQYVAATYTLTRITLKVTWVAI